MISEAGTAGVFQPMVLDSLRLTASLTLLMRRRAESSATSAPSRPTAVLCSAWPSGKLYLREDAAVAGAMIGGGSGSVLFGLI